MRIKTTSLASPDRLRAKLCGAVRADVEVVKKGKKYFFVAPKRLGGTREVPADSLTDGMNFSAWRLGEELALRRRRLKQKARRKA